MLLSCHMCVGGRTKTAVALQAYSFSPYAWTVISFSFVHSLPLFPLCSIQWGSLEDADNFLV